MLKQITLTGLALLLFIPFIGSAQFSITGIVKNKQTKEPAAGAIIYIEKIFISAQSNSDGGYEIKNLNTGSYIIHATLFGYQHFIDTIQLTENKTLDIELSENPLLMDEVIVASTRVDKNSAMTYTTVNKSQISEQNTGQDLPYLLNQQPSVVTTSDAGAGVGYTGIRMRGVDATRINVTINGIPVNDAESQGTYWVDLPDIASSIDNIQIQRGVGSSTNGAGAFGGSLNIETSKLQPKAITDYNTSYGTFNTFKNTINFGTGLLNDNFVFDGRLSKITSNGFIDRATSDLKSYYLSGGYYGKSTILKFITFSGQEETYQAWNGIPESRIKGDLQGMQDYIGRNYLDTEETNNLLNSNSRTYNQFTYKNQVDHYKQDYYQLHFSQELARNWNVNAALHYTKGKGYYEEYKKAQSFSNYNLQNVIIGVDTISSTNLIRRRWLDNDFYGTTFSVNYNSHKKLSVITGGAFNKYDGLHFGEIIWAQYASNGALYDHYYDYKGIKTDFNIFSKINYKFPGGFYVFTDIQYRTIDYSFLGYDNNLKNVQQSEKLNFINPKIGITYSINENANIYLSYSIGNKEPGSDDYSQSTPQSRPKAETLNDLELGYRHSTQKATWAITFYNMDYKNQLVLTGKVNDVGTYTRTNVASSYRRGIEAELGVLVLKKLTWNMNFTVSQNKINNFEEYVDDYDAGVQQKSIAKLTDIAFSPNLIAGNTFRFEAIKNLHLNFISKYVGVQFLDNTLSAERKLDAYLVHDIRINYTFKTKFIREVGMIIAINNILSEQYESNGYTWGYILGGKRISENFYYPQAGINYMTGLSFKF